MVGKKKVKRVSELVEGEGRRKSGPIMGIDVHKDMLSCCVLTEKQVLKELEVQNRKMGIDGLISLCKKLHVSSVALESTAQYHFKLTYKFLEADIPILVTNPQQTKSTQGKKIDTFDAKRIAVAHRDGRLKPSVISGKEIMSLRKVNRQLLRQINDATKIKQRLNQIFHQKEFEHKKLLKSKLGLKMLELVSNGMITQESLNSLLPKNSKRYVEENLIKALKGFQDSLDELEKITFGNDVMQLRLLDLAMERQRMAYYTLAKKNTNFRRLMELLLTIPGVGSDTAATILAEIADISYFKSSSKLAKWAGLAPKVYQSGHRKHITGKIHKGGNKFLRRALVLACQNIYAKGTPKNPLYRFIRSKKEQKDSYWLALCAGARKLLVLIWHMLKKGFRWNQIKPEPEIINKIQKAVNSKIKLFEGRLHKYKQTQEILSSKCEEIFENVQLIGNNPRMFLKTLINSF
ncbi:MAG: IS110 family transposase [Candidatus Helarchaeota archaeon]